MQKRLGKRKGRRGRFKSGADDVRQLQEIAKAQKAARQRKIPVTIESIAKSEQRVANRIRSVRSLEDAIKEFD